MNRQLLRDSIDVLKDIRAELPGNTDGSVLSRLDRTIRELEVMLEKSDTSLEIKSSDVLKLIGKVVEKLPEIIMVIDKLTRH